MAVTIKGIRVEHIVLERDEEHGHIGIKSAQYSLISSTDHVLAKQTVGGYGSMTLKPSAKTNKLLVEFYEAYREDVLAAIGLDLS